jgi:hypothetical protein
MTINGKRDGFRKTDIRAAGKSAGLKQGRSEALFEEVAAAVERWPEFAARAHVPADVTEKKRPFDTSTVRMSLEADDRQRAVSPPGAASTALIYRDNG